MNKNQLGSVVGGVVGGVTGTAVMQMAMQKSAKLPEKVQPPPMKRDPGEEVVDRLERASGRLLPKRSHALAVRGMHWSYGTFWGTTLGLFGSRLKLDSLGRTVAAGATLGAGVWALSYVGVLPALGLTPPVHKQKASRSASALASHVAYGVITALPIWAARKLFDRQ